MILIIARYELYRMFHSPLAWTVLAVVLFTLGLLFLVLVDNFLSSIQTLSVAQEGTFGVSDTVIAPTLLWAGIIMLAVSPLLSMRTFAEEQQRGSLTLLTSAPLSSTDIVLGKYLGLSGFLFVMLVLIGLMPVSLSLGTSLDWGKVACGLLGLYLLLASFAAAGLYLSSLTHVPLIAAVSTFGFLLVLVVLYLSGNSPAIPSELLRYLSNFGHFLPFIEGLFNSQDALYYLLFTITFLMLTIRHLDNQRLR